MERLSFVLISYLLLPKVDVNIDNLNFMYPILYVAQRTDSDNCRWVNFIKRKPIKDFYIH